LSELAVEHFRRRIVLRVADCGNESASDFVLHESVAADNGAHGRRFDRRGFEQHVEAGDRARLHGGGLLGHAANISAARRFT
jgi:hypothetical protein